MLSKAYLYKPVIQWLEKRVFNSKTSLCASLHIKSPNPSPRHPNMLVVTSETIVGNNNHCVSTLTNPLMIHIHNQYDYAYPTADDIIYLIRNRKKIHTNIIASKWGIWVLANDYTKQPTDLQKITSYIHQQLNVLADLTNKEQGTRSLLPSDKSTLQTIISRIKSYAHMDIQLYTWQNMADRIEIKYYTNP